MTSSSINSGPHKSKQVRKNSYTAWSERPHPFITRKNLGGSFKFLDYLDSLTDVQQNSFADFIQLDKPIDQRNNTGIERVFRSFFPIMHKKSNMEISYLYYEIIPPRLTIKECILRGLNYVGILRICLRLKNLSTEDTKDIWFNVGELPFMTEDGVFIINGYKRLFVSGLYRCPGIVLTKEIDTINSKKVSIAKVYPSHGSWLHFKIDKNQFFVSIDKKKSFSALTLLLCFPKEFVETQNLEEGYTVEEILAHFYEKKTIVLNQGYWDVPINPEMHFNSPILHNIYVQGEKIAAGTRLTVNFNIPSMVQTPFSEITGVFLAENILDPKNNNILIPLGTKLNETHLSTLKDMNISRLQIYEVNDAHPIYLLNSLAHEFITKRENALNQFANISQISTHYNVNSVSKLFIKYFSDIKNFDLTPAGRHQLNACLGLNKTEHYITFEDVVLTLKKLIQLDCDQIEPDDIDSFAKKIVKSTCEILEDYLRNGLTRFAKSLRNRSFSFDADSTKSGDIFHLKVSLYQLMSGFYQESQMLDNNNRVSQIAQPRKLNSGGYGTNNKERVPAGLRDMNESKFGKTCAITTPEGKKVGLVEHLALYARINEYGYLTTPYHRVNNGVVSEEIEFLSAFDEIDKVIASHADFFSKDDPILASRNYVVCRKNKDTLFLTKDQVEYIDIACNQIFSISASLIPFPGNNDPYRNLVAANMNCQAVPLSHAEPPFIGTGMERIIGEKIRAIRSGVVSMVDSKRIIIETQDDDNPIDVYHLTLYERTNTDTVIMHYPLVSIGDIIHAGDVIADGFNTKYGDVALGKNLIVLYQSTGLCYEDGLQASQSLVYNNDLSSVHVQVFECLVKETRFGAEKNTRDVPGVPQEALLHLDECGIVATGSYVKSGDIIVGKISPLSKEKNIPLSRKLLQIVFNERAAECNDSSLRLPNGVEGTVTKVEILVKRGVEKDSRSLLQDKETIDELTKNTNEKIQTIYHSLLKRISNTLSIDLTILKDKKETEIAHYCKTPSLKKLLTRFLNYKQEVQDEKKKITQELSKGYELTDGVLKIIRVYLASKKRIETGDKLCGRYGNKGVISNIVPTCDMPYLADGRSVDLIIGSLGILARMNLGQVLESTIGYAIYELRKKLRNNLSALLRGEDEVDELRKNIKLAYGTTIIEEVNLDTCHIKTLCSIGKDLVERGIFVQIEQFHNISDEKLKEFLIECGANADGKVEVYDGKTGDKFLCKMLVGYQFILKLCHMVSLKMHARSTGPYSLITLQPPAGKARAGGQRCGEMEVWALQAHGAAYNCHEILGVKSDDLPGRRELYESLMQDRAFTFTFMVLSSTKNSKRFSESYRMLKQELLAAGFKLTFDQEEQKVQIKLMSPEDVVKSSSGKITEIETLYYKTLNPIKDGLFCPVVFGPVNNYECICGKYSGSRYENVVCEKCGVKITHSSVRRERSGHIELPVKLMHPWFFRTTNNKIALLLDIPLKILKKIANLESYVVFNGADSPYTAGAIINEMEYESCFMNFMNFEAYTGAEVIHKMLSNINLDEKISLAKAEVTISNSAIAKKKCINIINICEAMKANNIRPEWMILSRISILPPDLRPLVEIDGGQFASSDLNELYKTVLYRVKRLNSLIMNQAAIPLILHNEIRILQDAVNKLYGTGNDLDRIKEGEKKYKSLEERIRGKEGSLRKTMLGKRADFSGRSVIVVDPTLKLNECRVPKEMALELLKPSVIGALRSSGLARSIKAAKRMIELKKPVVWDVLQELVDTKFPIVLLNRAPTLHKISILAFYLKLWDMKAMAIHPAVCLAFNADFDGDQMAIHIPLSNEAQAEAAMLMTPDKNLGSSTNGKLIIGAFKDVAFGLCALTTMSSVNTNLIVSRYSEVVQLLESKKFTVNDIITYKYNNKSYTTTLGRIMFWNTLPSHEKIVFDKYNTYLTVELVQKLFHEVRRYLGDAVLSKVVDDIKDLGFKYADAFGGSIGKFDFPQIPNAEQYIEHGLKKQCDYSAQINEGSTTRNEFEQKSLQLWKEVVMKGLKSLETIMGQDPLHVIALIISSGSRGSLSHLLQLVFMKGNVVNSIGNISSVPVYHNHNRGITSRECVAAAQGARKSCKDVALKTAEAGYLTRRLVDVANSCIINVYDCGTSQFILVKNIFHDGELKSIVFEKILGRILAHDIKIDDQILERGILITKDIIDLLEKHEITEVPIRSPVLCESDNGICAQCYGADLSTGQLISLGEAVGVVAAQSIGEPGTQLTMKSFHSGGVAKFGFTTTNIKAYFSGTVFLENQKILTLENGNKIVISRNMKLLLKNRRNMIVEEHAIPYGAQLYVEDQQVVQKDTILAQCGTNRNILAEFDGICSFTNLIAGVNYEWIIDENTNKKKRLIVKSRTLPFVVVSDNQQSISYFLPENTVLEVEAGEVKAGTILAYTRQNIEVADVVDGLHKVTEILENRPPRRIATLAPMSGHIKICNDTKNPLYIIDEQGKEHNIMLHEDTLIVQNGQTIYRGDVLTLGTPLGQDILEYKGIESLIDHFIAEIQSVYLDSGINIKINDKHFEVILYQMCRKFKVVDAGISDCFNGQILDITELKRYNKNLEARNMPLLQCVRLIDGITNMALDSVSFLSSASFQETVSVVTNAAIAGKTDELTGLKANIIVGNVIKAGTGFAQDIFKNLSKIYLNKIKNEHLNHNEDITEKVLEIFYETNKYNSVKVS